MEKAPRTPDYTIRCMNTVTGAKSGRLGVVWLNQQSGTLSIRLDPGVSITDGSDIMITAFPNTREEPA